MKNFYLSLCIVIIIVLLSVIVKIEMPSAEGFAFRLLDYKRQVVSLKEYLAKYDSLRLDLQSEQKRFCEFYQKANENERKELVKQSQKIIFKTITQDIIPYWLDTEWDFNGTTETPRKGTIACGYFVSTVLLHAGLDLDKYYLSRAPSEILIEELCDKKSIKKITGRDFEAFLAHLSNMEDGLYIVGLDKHTGFIAKSAGEISFIHSRKPREIGVIKEKADESKTLQKSSIHVIGNLLNNENLIRRWLQKKS